MGISGNSNIKKKKGLFRIYNLFNATHYLNWFCADLNKKLNQICAVIKNVVNSVFLNQAHRFLKHEIIGVGH